MGDEARQEISFRGPIASSLRIWPLRGLLQILLILMVSTLHFRLMLLIRFLLFRLGIMGVLLLCHLGILLLFVPR